MGADKNVWPAEPNIQESRFHPPGDASAFTVSTVGGRAYATVSAGLNGQRRVVTGYVFNVSSNVFLAASTIGCQIVDGALDTSTYLWQEVLAVTSTGARGALSGLNLVGSASTALTIQFTGTGISNATQCVSLAYHTIGGIGA